MLGLMTFVSQFHYATVNERKAASECPACFRPLCYYSCVGNWLKQAFFWRPNSPQETQGKEITASTAQAADRPLTTHPHVCGQEDKA